MRQRCRLKPVCIAFRTQLLYLTRAACWINGVAPTAMVMCPCVDGLSHNEAEEITKEWAKAGADVLLHAVLETAEIVG